MSENQNSVPDDEVVVGATDGVYTLLVADFADTESAWRAYETLKSVEDGRTFDIDGVVVVKRGDDGKVEVQKVTDHSTRSGLKWGVVGGIALGVIFPPTILGSTVAVGAAGAGVGKLRERHHRKELASELEDSIEIGHSGIVALVSDPGALKIREALAEADAIVQEAVEDVIAEDIKAAAKAAADDDSSKE